MKYLFILLLGLGFSQTELTTREYTIPISDLLIGNDYGNITLSDIQEITGTNLDRYLLVPYIDDIPGYNIETILFRQYFSPSPSSGMCIEGGVVKNCPESGSVDRFQTDFFLNEAYNWIFFDMIAQPEAFINQNVYLWITAAFPQEDTGYIEEGFEFCVSPGANLLSFPCDNPISVGASLPDGIENFIESIIGEGVATSYNPTLGWVGSLDDFDPGSGYWFKSNSSLCFEYDCVED